MSLHTRPVKGRISLILAGLIIGTFMISPASADFRKSISHIISHAKGTFYTKAQTDAKYTFFCQDPTEAFAYAYIDESVLTTSYSEPFVYWNCFGQIFVKQIAEGQYRVAIDGFTDSDSNGSQAPIASITGVGSDVNASFTYGNEATVGATMDVWLKDSGGTAVSKDFTIALHNWSIPDPGFGTTRVGGSRLANRPGTPRG